jgi:hypothetical protein
VGRRDLWKTAIKASGVGRFFFLYPGHGITMTTPERNYELLKKDSYLQNISFGSIF